MGAFWGTRVMEIVKKHDSGGLIWKRIKLTSTRKANAKTRLRRVWQVTLSLSFSISFLGFYGFSRFVDHNLQLSRQRIDYHCVY